MSLGSNNNDGIDSKKAAEDTDNTLEQKLIGAICSGDSDKVKKLCEQGADVNPNGYGSFVFKEITQQQATNLSYDHTSAVKRVIYLLRYNNGQAVLFSLNKHNEICYCYFRQNLCSLNNSKDFLNYAKEKKLVHPELTKDDYIPLYTAVCADAFTDKTKTIETLIEYGADPNIEIDDKHLLEIAIDIDFDNYYEEIVISLTNKMISIGMNNLSCFLHQKHQQYMQEIAKTQENSTDNNYDKKITVIKKAIIISENSVGFNTKPAKSAAPTQTPQSSPRFFGGNDGDSSMQPLKIPDNHEKDTGCCPLPDCCTFM